MLGDVVEERSKGNKYPGFRSPLSLFRCPWESPLSKLFGTILFEDGDHCLEQKLHVIEEASLAHDIVQIHIDHLVEGNVASSVCLPFPGQALRNKKAKPIPFGILLDFLNRSRARTD